MLQLRAGRLRHAGVEAPGRWAPLSPRRAEKGVSPIRPTQEWRRHRLPSAVTIAQAAAGATRGSNASRKGAGAARIFMRPQYAIDRKTEIEIERTRPARQRVRRGATPDRAPRSWRGSGGSISFFDQPSNVATTPDRWGPVFPWDRTFAQLIAMSRKGPTRAAAAHAPPQHGHHRRAISAPA